MDIVNIVPKRCKFINLGCGSDLSPQDSNPHVGCRFLLHCFVFVFLQIKIWSSARFLWNFAIKLAMVLEFCFVSVYSRHDVVEILKRKQSTLLTMYILYE